MLSNNRVSDVIKVNGTSNLKDVIDVSYKIYQYRWLRVVAVLNLVSVVLSNNGVAVALQPGLENADSKR